MGIVLEKLLFFFKLLLASRVQGMNPAGERLQKKSLPDLPSNKTGWRVQVQGLRSEISSKVIRRADFVCRTRKRTVYKDPAQGRYLLPLNPRQPSNLLAIISY